MTPPPASRPTAVPQPAAADAQRLGPDRLRPAGNPGADPAAVARRAALLALLAALALVAFVALRPLPPAPVVAGPAIQSFDQDPAPPAPLATQPIADLAERHAFSPWRQPLGWTAPAATPDTDDQQTADADPDPQPTHPPTDGARRIVLEVDDPDTVMGEVKQSFETINLLGIASGRDGDLRALLAFTHAPGAPAAAVPVGRTFTVPNATSADREPLDWRLQAIDAPRRRVLVSHDDATLAIALFPTRDALTSPFEVTLGGGTDAPTTGAAADATADAASRDVLAEDGTTVRQESMSSIVERLREEGHEADLEDIFKMMGMSDVAPGDDASEEDNSRQPEGRRDADEPDVPN